MIMQGTVRVSINNCVLRTMHKGETFGELALLGKHAKEAARTAGTTVCTP